MNKGLKFFFGWLIKGQYEVSMLDGIICFLEIMAVVLIVFYIKEFIERLKNGTTRK